ASCCCATRSAASISRPRFGSPASRRGRIFASPRSASTRTTCWPGSRSRRASGDYDRGEGFMTHGAREVGPRRWRESFGRYFEEFEVGDVYEHRPGRTVNETDNTWFTLLTMNNHPLHFDAEYAAQSEFKRPLVNSCLTLSI